MVHSIKKMISVMDAERDRRRLVASEGRATRGTVAGADIRDWRQLGVLASARFDGAS